MSGYCHKRSFPLRYTDFDFADRLKPKTVLSLAQEAACSSAEELGFGYEALKEKNYGFITVYTDCELFAPALLGETLTVETWPLPPRHGIFERDYRISGQMGLIGKLASRWCLVDLPHFAILPPEALGRAHEECPYNPEKLLEAPMWKIPKLGGEGEEVYRCTVRQSLCDHYLHANNTEYADLFLDCFSMADMPAVKRFQIAYLRQAKEGTELALYRKCGEGEVILEAREGETPVAQCRLLFGEKEMR